MGCDVVAGAQGADAAAVAYDALDACLARGADTLIIDTAGRMHTRQPLMEELAKISRTLEKRLEGAPHETWMVLDASLGQNAVIQAQQFNKVVPITGIIITKLDGSSKAGFLFSVRSELNVPPGKRSDLYVRVNEPSFGKLLQEHIEYFRSLARVEELHTGTDIKKPPLSASTVISQAEIFIPLEGLIDIEVEKKRLEKELTNLKNQLEKVSRKLANHDFLNNAPEDVIEKEKSKKKDYQERIERLNKNLEQILGW